jgi:hypothetical protein
MPAAHSSTLMTPKALKNALDKRMVGQWNALDKRNIQNFTAQFAGPCTAPGHHITTSCALGDSNTHLMLSSWKVSAVQRIAHHALV